MSEIENATRSPSRVRSLLPAESSGQSGSIWRATLFGRECSGPYGVIGKDLGLRADETTGKYNTASCCTVLAQHDIKFPKAPETLVF
jgi:hypothetical protein